jgi:hypothetical protein
MVLWRESTKAYPEARGSHETLVPQVREPKDYWRTMREPQNGSVMSARALVELNFDSFGVGRGAEMVSEKSDSANPINKFQKHGAEVQSRTMGSMEIKSRRLKRETVEIR